MTIDIGRKLTSIYLSHSIVTIHSTVCELTRRLRIIELGTSNEYCTIKGWNKITSSK